MSAQADTPIISTNGRSGPEGEEPSGPRWSPRFTEGSDSTSRPIPVVPSQTHKLKDAATTQGDAEAKSSTTARAEAYLNCSAQASTTQTSRVNQRETSDQSEIPERTGFDVPSSQMIPTTGGSGSQTASSQKQAQIQVNMAVATAKVAGFRVPRSWESDAPKFTTDDPDDLVDFLDQVGDIIELAGIKTDNEKKKLLTSYLPVRKRMLWRSFDNYENLSYDDFLESVYNIYPEVKQDEKGTLEALDELCNKHQGIRLQDEGKLKRFGAEFSLLVKKLMKQPAIILNKDACHKYLETLDASFVNILCSAMSVRNLFKADINKAAGVQPPVVNANAVDRRKEDPILLEDLVETAEQLASMGVTGATWGGYDVSQQRRLSELWRGNFEQGDKRLEGISEDVTGLKDSIMGMQREVKVPHTEIMEVFQTPLRDVCSHDNGTPYGSSNLSEQVSNHFGWDHFYRKRDIRHIVGCFYCGQHDHFSRKCPVKIEHVRNGWLMFENGIQLLGDGNPVPKGQGPPSVQVEEYYARKSASGKCCSVAASLGAPDRTEMDAIRDELRSLRVQLNRLGDGSYEPVMQHAYMASAPVLQRSVTLPMVQPAWAQVEPPYSKDLNGQAFNATAVQYGYMAPAPVPHNYMDLPVVQPAYIAQAPTRVPLPSVTDEQAFNNIQFAMMNFINANAGT